MTNAKLQALLAKHKGLLPVQFLDVGSDSDVIAYRISGVELGSVSVNGGPEKPVLYVEGEPTA